jgi:hypothetical protein
MVVLSRPFAKKKAKERGTVLFWVGRALVHSSRNSPMRVKMLRMTASVLL